VPPKKKGGFGKKALSFVGVILVLVVIGVVKFGIRSFFSDEDKTADATVGSCLTQAPDIKDVAIVDCADAAAAHKVVGKVPNVSEATFDTDTTFATCGTFATAENSMWSGVKGSDGYVLCLEPVKK
jgi:hypothetical protein